MPKKYVALGLVVAVIAVLDQWTKALIAKNIPFYGSVPIIDGFFNLVHIHNRGMVFGLWNRPGNHVVFLLLILITIGAIVGMIIWFLKLKKAGWIVTVAFGLIMGGAFGNLIDRLFPKRVIDFLDFYIGSLHWPAFNIADSAITVGVCLLAYSLFFLPVQLE